MVRSELLFQTPYWFIAFCFLAGAAYAFLLYKTSSPWGPSANWGLAVARALVVGLIVFLLLNPLVRSVSNQVQKAQLVLAIDNSASLGSFAKNVRDAGHSLTRKLQEEGFDLRWEDLEGNIPQEDSIQFDAPKTDLSAMLRRLKKGYEGEHLTDVILISDGIINQGSSPAYEQYPFRVHTLAVGDTTPVTDLWVQDVVHNKVAFLGNKFPIRAEVAAKGLAGKSVTVFLKQAGKVIGKENIRIDRDVFFKEINFLLSSEQKGMQRYTISLSELPDEHTLTNNSRNVFIDIIDGRQQILLLAATPHPDIKAIKGMLETDDNYEVTTQILSVTGGTPKPGKPYDLVILHQIPHANNLGSEYLRELLQQNVPILYIIGNQSNISAFNSVNKAVQINQAGPQKDLVRGIFNPSFSQLNLNSTDFDILPQLPPLSVPFGEYTIRNGAEVVLHQKVGSLPTSKPLLVVHQADQSRSAVLMGEGLWAWRQEEFALTRKHVLVDQLFQKLTQLMSIKEDKRKFRVYNNKPSYDAGEVVTFRTEIYNNVYEHIYGQEIKLELTDDQSKSQEYQYTHTPESEGFQISSLAAGAYRYKATSTLNGESVSATGAFVVQSNDLEMVSTRADFAMLQELAKQSGGIFVAEDAIDALVEKLVQNRPVDRIESTETLQELIRFRWLFFLLITLLALEWALRKYLGGY
ncbi:hypothetical protein [Dyadobacter tibetensis]|uniref:hypothetical protein n=1 Tax=Dyadobacter tibetensis TaxID=1211851 RepID=UPI000472C85E|nr:hypothetical protein [Dyadobacter tibetensis]